jgi:hypothetical protein
VSRVPGTRSRACCCAPSLVSLLKNTFLARFWSGATAELQARLGHVNSTGMLGAHTVHAGRNLLYVRAACVRRPRTSHVKKHLVYECMFCSACCGRRAARTPTAAVLHTLVRSIWVGPPALRARTVHAERCAPRTLWDDLGWATDVTWRPHQSWVFLRW